MKTLAYLLLLFLSACSSEPNERATLRLAFHSGAATLDPRKSGDFISSTLICLIFEGLTRALPGGDVEPALAEKIEISEDGRLYTFFLRKTSWSDGKPVTAKDFETSWKKIVDPSFASPSAYLLFPIKNAERCARGEVGIDAVGIHAEGTRVLRVELERPTPYFLSLTAFPLFFPAPAHEELVSGRITNGPFQIVKERMNSELRLAKNKDFWNEKAIHVNEIRIQFISDENTALQMFERGEIDWLGAPLSPLPLDALHALNLRFIPMNASTLLAFNTERFPFQNLKIRKALALSLEREKIVSEIALMGQTLAERPLPPSLFKRPLPPLFPPPDLELSLALFSEGLNELGVSPSDLKSLTLYYKGGQLERRLAQALQRSWKESLGFTIRLEQLEPKTHLDRLHRRDYQIALGVWISQFHDPVNILERYRLKANQKNFAGWENSQYQALLEEAALERDPEVRAETLAAAEAILADEIPVLPLYHWASPSLTSARLKEIPTTPSGGILFERVEFNEL
jgi:oligopeptide transport system substrate-binding protein